jgi:hypothetical protein
VQSTLATGLDAALPPRSERRQILENTQKFLNNSTRPEALNPTPRATMFADLIKRLFKSSAPRRQAGDTPAPPQDNQTVTRWRKALSDFGFPHTVLAAEGCAEVLKAEQEQGVREGFTPVVIVPGYWNSTQMAATQRARRASKLSRRKYDAAHGREWLTRTFAELQADLEQDHDEESEGPDLFDTLRPVEAQPREPGLHLLRRYNAATRSMEYRPQVAIMRIPTRESHTIPVYLDWGGWNAVPSPLEIAAISRHWGETYGAELAAIGSDTLEFTVRRKPASHAEAVALLKEQYSFAPDTWEYDRDMLEGAAAELRNGDSWFFWWD